MSAAALLQTPLKKSLPYGLVIIQAGYRYFPCFKLRSSSLFGARRENAPRLGGSAAGAQWNPNGKVASRSPSGN